MGLYVGNTKYKVMSGNNKASLFPVYPYDSEVEYLESTGTQYIVTNTIPDNGEWKLETSIKVNETGQNAGVVAIYGDVRFYLLDLYTTKFRVCNFGGSWSNSKALLKSYVANQYNTVISTIKPNLVTLTVNGSTVQLSVADGAPTTNTPFGIFTRWLSNDNPSSFSKVSIKYMKLFKENILVNDFIPVRIGSIGYMYDKVSGLLFGNSGTGNFVLGPDKPIYDAEVEYLESTGTQYIDLDYFQGNKLQINLDCECYLVQTPEVNIISNQSGSSSTSGGRFVLGLSYGKVFIYSRNNNSQSDGNAAISLNGRARKQITAIFNQSSTKSLTVDGTTETAPCVSVSNNKRRVRIFSGINGSTGEAAVFYSGRLYSVKFYKDDILWIDLIPVRVGTTGYMYDTISHKLFGNAGTGSFILGNDKN